MDKGKVEIVSDGSAAITFAEPVQTNPTMNEPNPNDQFGRDLEEFIRVDVVPKNTPIDVRPVGNQSSVDPLLVMAEPGEDDLEYLAEHHDYKVVGDMVEEDEEEPYEDAPYEDDYYMDEDIDEQTDLHIPSNSPLASHCLNLYFLMRSLNK